MYLLQQKNEWEKLASDLAEAGKWELIHQIQIIIVKNAMGEVTRFES